MRAEPQHHPSGFFWLLWILLALASAAQADSEVLRVTPAKRLLTLEGYSRAWQQATLAAEVSGRVTEVNYEVGQTLAAAPLVAIDPTFIDLDLAQLHSDQRALRLAHAKAERLSRFLEQEYQRHLALRDSGGVARARFDDISQQRDQARLELDALAEQQQRLQIEQQRLEQQRRRHQPQGPAGWQIVERLVSPGDWVTSGSPLLRVADYCRLLVPLQVTAEERGALLQQLQTGPLAAALAGQPVRCCLYSDNPAFDPTSRKRQLTLEILAPPWPRGGDLLQLALSLDDGGLQLPLAALERAFEQPRVRRADGQWVPVRLRELRDGQALIDASDQLPAGTPLARLRD